MLVHSKSISVLFSVHLHAIKKSEFPCERLQTLTVAQKMEVRWSCMINFKGLAHKNTLDFKSTLWGMYLPVGGLWLKISFATIVAKIQYHCC